jgi:hypothetical protein
MKNSFILTLFALIVLAATNPSTAAAQEIKEKSCAGGCCGKEMAMADPKEAGMQEHSKHKHEQRSKDTTAKKEEMKMQAEYTCPMHPEVKSDKPGKCPKCGMALVEVKKDNKSTMKQKMKAMMDGKYNCCIEDACDECLKMEGSCDCKNAVKNNKPVCGECYEGWQHGKGAVSGKSAKDIKKEHEHKQ